MEWQGSVWLNLSYAKDLTAPFIDKLMSSDIEQAMVLVNNATETAWGQKLLSEATVVCFLSGQGSISQFAGKSRNATSGPNARRDQG